MRRLTFLVVNIALLECLLLEAIHGLETPTGGVLEALGLPETAPSPNGPPKRALLVGISKYSRNRGGGLDWRDLPIQDDIPIMREVLKRKYGFQDQDIRSLADDQATRANIETAFREHLIKPADKGDVVLFYFTGHGQLVPDSTAWAGTRPALVTFDYHDQDARNGWRTHFRSDHLRELLRELKARMRGADGNVAGNITVILDACHSGGGTKGIPDEGMIEKGRPWDTAIDGPKPQPNAGVQRPGAGGYLDIDQAIAEGYTFISACRSDQSAVCPVQGTKVSLLTYHLAQGLAKAGPDTSYHDLYEPVTVALSRFQIPQLEGDGTKRLLAGTAVPAEQYWVVQDVTGGVVTLPVGFVQGATKGSRFAIFRKATSTRNAQNKVAEVEITEVLTTSCRGKPTGAYAEKTNDADLQAGRAVEVEHNYAEQNLRVWLDGLTLPTNWIGKDDYLISDGVGKLDYDVALRYLSEHPDRREPLALIQGRPVIVVQRRDGTEIARFATAEYTTDMLNAALRDRLIGEWRWLFLSQHLKAESRRGDRVAIEIRVVPLDVKVNVAPMGRRLEIVGTRKDFRENQPLKQLQVGDWVTVEVRNVSKSEDVYISILDLGPKGNVTPLFPFRSSKPLDQIPSVKLPVGQNWTRIPDFVIGFSPPVGREVFKVIATLEPADFRDLFYRAPGTTTKRAVQELPPMSRGLGQLLEQARRGTKDAMIAEIGVDWASAEVAFEVIAAP
jgi:hypothetical protein